MFAGCMVIVVVHMCCCLFIAAGSIVLLPLPTMPPKSGKIQVAAYLRTSSHGNASDQKDSYNRQVTAVKNYARLKK